jgi:hypothetical protein
MIESSDPNQVHERYLAAFTEYGAPCRTAPERRHQPNASLFTELRGQLTPHAEAGHADCQYALAIIAWWGLCCESEEQYEAAYAQGMEEATRWWVAAGRQGCSRAVDNLLTCGVGPEAERARAISKEVTRDSAHLIGHDVPTGMPIYGPAFMKEVARRLYGVVRSGE